MGDKTSSEDLFPPGKFFQARYAALALQAKLCEQIRNVRICLGLDTEGYANQLKVKLG